MTRVRIAGLCVLAVVAAGALASASASAAEYGQCRFVAKKGHYADSGCTTLDEKKGKGKGAYEWIPGPAQKCYAIKHGKFNGPNCETEDVKKGKGKGTMEKQAGPAFTAEGGLAGGNLTCTAGKASGEVTGLKTGTMQITYTGCTYDFEGTKYAVTTSGQASGTLKSATFDTNLLEPTPGEVLTQYVSTSGPSGSLIEGGANVVYIGLPVAATFKLYGEGAGVTTGNINTPSSTDKVAFAKLTGEQHFKVEVEAVVLGNHYHFPSTPELEGTAAFMFASPVEIRT